LPVRDYGTATHFIARFKQRPALSAKQSTPADAGNESGPGVLNTNFRIAAALALAALLVTLVMGLSFWAFHQIEDTSRARVHTYEAISRANTLLSELKDAETGQRGFSLTGDEHFLQPYLSVRKNLSGHLQELRAHTLISAAGKHLDAIAPLLEAKLSEMTYVIELRRNKQMTALLAAAGGSSEGRRLMDSIRAEMSGYIEIEERALADYDDKLLLNMRLMFVLIVTASVCTFMLALSFAYLIYREMQHRLKTLLHTETRHLLDIQEDLNRQLQHTKAISEISEEKLAITLNSIGDAVIATDASGRVTLLNPLAQKLTGWTPADAMNRPIEDVFHIVNQQTRLPSPVPVRDTLEHNTTHGLANHTILIARDGSERDVADSCAPIRTRSGQMVGAVLVFRDVTERARLDRTLLDKNEELQTARAVADKANLAKSDFLSSMSHELRTPLSAILGFAQLMESSSPPPSVPQKRSIDQILKAGWYLLDLINEILDLALIESGRLSLSIEPILLADVLQECETMMGPQAEKRNITITFPPRDIPFVVKADRTRVKQIMVNLLSNAIKYNSPGGSVVVDCSEISAQRVRIRVTDTGPGLPPEKIAQLFQPFNRLGQEITAEEGTGIGLVVSQRLVELMDGAISAESTVGKGSVFSLELNLTPAINLAAAQHIPISAAQAAADAPLRSVLYVEDNPANLMLVEDLIARRSDLRMLSARDGVTGIEIALASTPNLILMDINLPGISGIDALRILSENAMTAHIPVIAVSANAMPRDIEKGLEAGFFRYLTKPIKVNEFMATLDLALQFADSRATDATTEEKV
jgi:PAS domain S-box-containing protein